MTFQQQLILTLITVGGLLVGVIGTALAATRDLRLRRQLETTDRFLRIAATAQARGRGDDKIGTSEQMAAIKLLGEFGKYRHLKAAAVAALTDIDRYTYESAKGTEVAALRVEGILDLVLPEKRDEVAAALSGVQMGANVSRLVGSQAREALSSLGVGPNNPAR